MEKRRDSRHELSNLAPSTGRRFNDDQVSANRRSERLSQSDIRVADGFRPVSPLTSSSAQPELARPTTTRSMSTPQTSSEQRNSISKGPAVGLALSEDSSSTTSNERPFDPNTSRFDRSASSNSSYETLHSPYHARISRISFSYPRRPASAAGSSSRPAHPYALYQQTTFEEPDEPQSLMQTPPIGFPGRTAAYRRRIGPDGEELDVVGPDGHTEELPPYSRYPEAGPLPNKQVAQHQQVVSPSLNPSSPASSSVAPSLSTPPAPPQTADAFLSMGHIPLQPSPVSQSPSLPSPQHSADSNDSRGLRSSASSMVEEKHDKPAPGRHAKRHKRILCGTVPLWAVLLFAILCIFLAVIAGGVIGGMVSQQRQKQSHRSNKDKDKDGGKVTITNHASMWDASPIPAPTRIPKLPSGTFFFPLGFPGEQERRCIEPSRDTTAWSCTVNEQLLLIDFGSVSNYPTAKIYGAPPPSGFEGVQYGPQPPRVNPTQKLIWVTDTQDPTRGPALHFQTVYDKIVIIEGDRFPAPDVHMRKNVKRADASDKGDKPDKGDKGDKDDKDDKDEKDDRGDRGNYRGPPPSMAFDPTRPPRHRFANAPGEEPWYCYWNATFIEGFIYIQQPVVGAETQQFTASQLTTQTSLPTGFVQGSPVSPMTSTLPNFPAATPQVSARAILHPRSPGSKPSSTNAPTPTQPPSRFPFIIKLEERRLPNPAFQPFCQRMSVGGDGNINPKLDVNGNPIIEQIPEAQGGYADPQVTAGVTPGSSSHQKKGREQNFVANNGYKRLFRRQMGEWEVNYDGAVIRRNQEPSNSCHCQWVSPTG